MADTITSFKQAARRFGVRPETIGDVVRKRRIDYDTYGMLKGLSAKGMRELEAVLSPPSQSRRRSAS